MSHIDSQVSNDKMLTLLSTIKYLDKIVTEHKIWAGTLIISIVATIMLVSMYIYKSLTKFEGFVNVAIFFLLIIFSIGVIRFFIHSTSNQIRLLKDARERSSMVLTYLALLEKNTLPDGQARDLILQCLFSSVISRCVSGVNAFL